MTINIFNNKKNSNFNQLILIKLHPGNKRSYHKLAFNYKYVSKINSHAIYFANPITLVNSKSNRRFLD